MATIIELNKAILNNFDETRELKLLKVSLLRIIDAFNTYNLVAKNKVSIVALEQLYNEMEATGHDKE